MFHLLYKAKQCGSTILDLHDVVGMAYFIIRLPSLVVAVSICLYAFCSNFLNFYAYCLVLSLDIGLYPCTNTNGNLYQLFIQGTLYEGQKISSGSQLLNQHCLNDGVTYWKVTNHSKVVQFFLKEVGHFILPL